MLSSWVIWVGSKCSNGSPYKREEREILRLRHSREKPREEGGGDVAESCGTPELPGAKRGRKHPFLEPLEEDAC